MVDAVEPVVVGNVRRLAGDRYPRHDLPGVAAAPREVSAEPVGLLKGAALVGDPIAVPPVLFHLLWRRELHVGLSPPPHTRAVVSR
ncbi:hypothetical protein [Saccharothrix lopnurensis]|uniref:Uncharacterized protein n=1 Tax=Saccharothrix lopnurensis TaxID=1670621 RepID=A0ABW1PGB0_9PSEU